jgi:translation initiation factor IF-3
MDFGKYKYQMGKKQTAKKTQQDVKVIKLRPRIDVHDLERKVKHMREFLDEGDKVKVVMSFRGREKGRPDLGMKVYDKLKEMLTGTFVVTQEPKQEGSIITMSISPK